MQETTHVDAFLALVREGKNQEAVELAEGLIGNPRIPPWETRRIAEYAYTKLGDSGLAFDLLRMPDVPITGLLSQFEHDEEMQKRQVVRLFLLLLLDEPDHVINRELDDLLHDTLGDPPYERTALGVLLKLRDRGMLDARCHLLLGRMLGHEQMHLLRYPDDDPSTLHVLESLCRHVVLR